MMITVCKRIFVLGYSRGREATARESDMALTWLSDKILIRHLICISFLDIAAAFSANFHNGQNHLGDRNTAFSKS